MSKQLYTVEQLAYIEALIDATLEARPNGPDGKPLPQVEWNGKNLGQLQYTHKQWVFAPGPCDCED